MTARVSLTLIWPCGTVCRPLRVSGWVCRGPGVSWTRWRLTAAPAEGPSLRSASGVAEVPPESALAIESQVDVEHARRWARTMARSVGSGPTDTESVVLSVSELATNLLRYAQAGLILLTLLC